MIVEFVIGHTSDKLEILITSSLDEDATNESWAFRDFYFYYEPINDCASLFTECNYQGESFDICDENTNF